MRRHPYGAWSDLEFTLAEARRVMEEHHCKTLPSQDRLRELSYSSLGHAIVEYHGGFPHFRALLDQRLLRREKGTWKNLEYATAEALKVMREHRCTTLPSDNGLRRLGYSSLAHAIAEYHGGFPYFRIILGQGLRQRKRGTWKDLECVVAEAHKVMEKHGFKALPSANKLEQLGYSSLASAISKYHRGFSSFRKLLGEELQQRERGTWKDLEYALAEARRVMEKHGFRTLPSINQLQPLGYFSLANAISRYHGGFSHFRSLLGQDLRQRRRGTWDDLRYVVAEARRVMEEHHCEALPSEDRLKKLGYSSLVSAISRYHGGFSQFRISLGQELLRRENGAWKNLEYTIAEARKVMEKHGFSILPSGNKLERLGYSSLVNAIGKYHHGSTAFRIKLGEYDQALAVVRKLVEETV